MCHDFIMDAKSSPVESVDRALLLVLHLRETGPLSVTEAAEYLGVAASTAHRLLNALAYRGFAAQSHDRRYRAGHALSAAGSEGFPAQLIRQVAHEPLLALHQAVGETVQLMVLHGGNIQFIDGVESSLTLRVGMRLGDKMPAFVSAGGKAILAKMANADLEELYSRGIAQWPTGKISSLTELKKAMTRIRRDGYATNFEETEQGVIGVGVAVCDQTGQPVAGLTTATPSIRFDRAAMPEHVHQLLEAAGRISEQLHRAVR